MVPVGGLGVGMEVALEVGEFHQLREFAGARGFDLAAVFAQLGRNPRQAYRAIHGFFRTARDSLFTLEYAIFADFELALLRQPADVDVVTLRAGEVLQRGTKAILVHDPHIHLQAGFEDHRGARGTLGQHVLDLVVSDEAVHHIFCVTGCHQNIDIAHGLLEAAVGTGEHRLVHAGNFFEIFPQRFGVLRRHGQLEAGLLFDMRGDRFEDGLFGFLTETGKLADTPVTCRTRQLFECVHVEFVVQRAHAFGPEARNFKQLGDGRGSFLAQLLQELALAGLDDLLDFGGEVVADAGQFGQVLAPGHHV